MACETQPYSVFRVPPERCRSGGSQSPQMAVGPQAELNAMTPKPMIKSSRRERVAAQYRSEQSVFEYADAYQNSRTVGRFLRTRLRLVQDVLASCPGGDLLDAGCGPGVMTQTLLKSRPEDFRISVLDQSQAMIEYCTTNARTLGTIYPAVGQLEALPYAAATFDVTLVMGVLEYANARVAVSEISRVTRPGGLVVVTMLNPLSPHRIAEWLIYRPLIRLLGVVEICLRVPVDRRHRAGATGIHTVMPGKLRNLMRRAGLEPVDLVYYDLASPVPPFGRLPSWAVRAGRPGSARPAAVKWSRLLGTGYLVAAKRS
jgi:ubiquinone/menaquinone biosynthesis C-methylase UbiE